MFYCFFPNFTDRTPHIRFKKTQFCAVTIGSSIGQEWRVDQMTVP